MAAAFYGIQPVVAVVVEAVLRIGKKALRHGVLYAFAALAFVAVFSFHVSFPYVVAGAALGGLLIQRRLPQLRFFVRVNWIPIRVNAGMGLNPSGGEPPMAFFFACR